MTEKATGLVLLQRQCHQRLCVLARTEGNLQAALNSSAAIQVIESKGFFHQNRTTRWGTCCGCSTSMLSPYSTLMTRSRL